MPALLPTRAISSCGQATAPRQAKKAPRKAADDTMRATSRRRRGASPGPAEAVVRAQRIPARSEGGRPEAPSVACSRHAALAGLTHVVLPYSFCAGQPGESLQRMRRISTPAFTSSPGQTSPTDVAQQRMADGSFALPHRKRPIQGLKAIGLLSDTTSSVSGGSSKRRPSTIGVRAHARLVAESHRRRARELRATRQIVPAAPTFCAVHITRPDPLEHTTA